MITEHGATGGEQRCWKHLREAQIRMIDDALAEIGDFGEVRLIVSKGRLRFVVTQRSHDALQWEQAAANSRKRVEVG